MLTHFYIRCTFERVYYSKELQLNSASFKWLTLLTPITQTSQTNQKHLNKYIQRICNHCMLRYNHNTDILPIPCRSSLNQLQYWSKMVIQPHILYILQYCVNESLQALSLLLQQGCGLWKELWCFTTVWRNRSDFAPHTPPALLGMILILLLICLICAPLWAVKAHSWGNDSAGTSRSAPFPRTHSEGPVSRCQRSTFRPKTGSGVKKNCPLNHLRSPYVPLRACKGEEVATVENKWLFFFPK